MNFKTTIILAGIALVFGHAPQGAAAQGKSGKGQAAAAEKVQGKSQGKSNGQGKASGNGDSQDEVKGQDKVKGTEKANGQSKARNLAGSKLRKTKGGPAKAGNRGRTADKSNRQSQRIAGRSADNRGRAKFIRRVSTSNLPAPMRAYASSRRPHMAILANAASYAYARKHGDGLRIDALGNRMRLSNGKGNALVALDEESARNMGKWRVGVVSDELRDGAPSFCRSGQGHPVWGRQWCLDKGFGLASYNDYRWGRTNDLGDIVFIPGQYGNTIGSDALMSVLGTNAFNRLALHAVTLGLLEPLVGRWVSQETGPRLLTVNSGTQPVAEFEDVNRDNLVDNLLVSLLPWF